jgi:hypothetical protein
MKSRILIFCLLGPAASYVVLAALSEGFPSFLSASDALVAVPAVYVVELAPFLLCALIDFFIEEAKLWERLVVAAISGFATTFIAAWMIGAIPQKFQMLQIGLIGAIPAVLCSLLAGKSNRSRATETL